jgi:hypothetical protein
MKTESILKVTYLSVNYYPLSIWLVNGYKYDMKRLKALINHKSSGKVVYFINPAFWRGLEIQAGHRE